MIGLVEAKKANLVVIADDVDPIELVVFLPALCRKMGVPYTIVKGKARLGAVVGRKTSSVVRPFPCVLACASLTSSARQLAFGEVKAEDKAELAKLVSAIKSNYTDKNEEARKHWGGGVRGHKSAFLPLLVVVGARADPTRSPARYRQARGPRSRCWTRPQPRLAHGLIWSFRSLREPLPRCFTSRCEPVVHPSELGDVLERSMRAVPMVDGSGYLPV